MKLSLLSPLVLLLAVGCARHGEAPAAPETASVRVRLATVESAEMPVLTDVTGALRPVRRAVLASRVMGEITELHVTLGQSVQAGEVLVRLFSADTEARLTQAKAQLNLARRDLERERDLLAKGASTAETVRSLQDRLTGVEASVRDAEVQLGYGEIRAPFPGVIARRPANSGDLASPGQPLLEIEGTGEFEVEAGIPNSLASGLRVGAAFACEAGGTRFTTTLKEISSAADPGTRSVGVKLAVPAGTAVRSGQFVRIQVPGPAVRTVLVASEAVSLHGQMERVFVAGEGNRAVLRLVKTGATRDGRVEILAGLSANERVVLAPPAGLREGQPLEVQP